jgi:putative transposase
VAYFDNQPSELSKLRRCNLLGINRSRVYYAPKPLTVEELELRTTIYDIWNEDSYKGSRTIREELIKYHNMVINRKRVQRVMGKLGISGILPKKNLSKLGKLEYKHPYYLGGMVINMANQVWGTDITYVKLPTGMMYVICLLDLFSRYVVGYVITNTLDTSGCIECFNLAADKHGKPHILNSDQGSQYTSHAWVSMLQMNDVIISMDSKGRWADNVYVERFWRTLKRECIYFLGIESAAQLHVEVARYINKYNTYRLHSALGYRTPEAVYLESLTKQNEFIPFCNWPVDEERVRVNKKIVLPTMALQGGNMI